MNGRLGKWTTIFAVFLALISTNLNAVPQATAATRCSRPAVSKYKAYNYNCSWAYHFLITSSRGQLTVRRGPTVGPASWSYSSMLWIGIVGYGARASGIRVNYQ